MYRGGRSRLFPILVVIIIAAVVIFGLVSLVRSFTSGGKKETKTQTLTSQLLNTDTDRSVSMTVRGPIVGDEAYRSYSITISPTNRVFTSWQGYDHTKTLDSETLGNNTTAYTQFVNALNYAGYTKTASVKSNDTDGLCASGRVYDFVLAQGANSVNDRWTTNCGIKGSFTANGSAIRALFLLQIQDAQEKVSTIGL